MADQGWIWQVRIPAVLAAATVIASAVVSRGSRQGLSFGLSALSIALLTATFFGALYPNALPSTTNPAYDLTLRTASSSHYTLVVMTIVAVIFVPIVLAYQAWTYWVFRHRLGRDDYEGALTPVAVMEHLSGGKSH
jgi:cytochrome d ubiquinol oxidase subunit II